MKIRNYNELPWSTRQQPYYVWNTKNGYIMTSWNNTLRIRDSSSNCFHNIPFDDVQVVKRLRVPDLKRPDWYTMMKLAFLLAIYLDLGLYVFTGIILGILVMNLNKIYAFHFIICGWKLVYIDDTKTMKHVKQYLEEYGSSKPNII